MKRFLLLAIFLFNIAIAFAQGELIVQHSDKGMFLNHTVAAKENFYSVGRMYNIPPKEIAAFNNLEMEKGLNIGQVIRIPLSVSNFSQSAEGGKPVYYVVGEKEGLYRVSLKNNNVLMADLRKWNKLPNDNITVGKKLIVGFLTAVDGNPATPAVAIDKPVETRPAEPRKEVEPQREQTVLQQPEKKPEPQRKPDPAPVKSEAATVKPTLSNDVNGGYFKPLYEKQVKATPVSSNETLTAGIFKTASGWQDGKFYVLMDKVEPGTIIKIVNPSNNKAVYAKVLGEMSGIRQNQGYDLRMSNAAAAALEVTELEKFIVRVEY